MKKVIYLILVLSLFLFGCSTESGKNIDDIGAYDIQPDIDIETFENLFPDLTNYMSCDIENHEIRQIEFHNNRIKFDYSSFCQYPYHNPNSYGNWAIDFIDIAFYKSDDLILSLDEIPNLKVFIINYLTKIINSFEFYNKYEIANYDSNHLRFIMYYSW